MTIQKLLPIQEDGTYDYSLAENGDRKIATNSEQIALFLKERLQFYGSEWVYDTRAGIPWTQLMKKPIRKNLIDSIVKAEILQTEGVTGLIDYLSIYHGAERRFSISFRYTDVFSEEQELTVNI